MYGNKNLLKVGPESLPYLYFSKTFRRRKIVSTSSNILCSILVFQCRGKQKIRALQSVDESDSNTSVLESNKLRAK